MNVEKQSMNTSNAWKIVDLPEGVKSVGCKSIYKKKGGLDAQN